MQDQAGTEGLEARRINYVDRVIAKSQTKFAERLDAQHGHPHKHPDSEPPTPFYEEVGYEQPVASTRDRITDN